MAIFVTNWAVLILSTKIALRVFKDLPEPPAELKLGLNFTDYLLWLLLLPLYKVQFLRYDMAVESVCHPPLSIIFSKGSPCSNRSKAAPTLNE